MNNPVYEILNCRGRLIALCADGTVWLFDVPDRKESKTPISKIDWVRLPDIPKPDAPL